MTTEIADCPNCGAKLKSGLLSNIKLLSESRTKIINEYHDKVSPGYCNKCGSDLYSKYELVWMREREEIGNKIYSIIHAIPVVSTHLPLNWNYDILQMVTGQSTTGTGFISEFTSSFTDLFGLQSGKYNAKLKAGEEMCFAQLRKQTLDLGGNAVIATDIDYSEVGGEKGMLMVCMSGTAIRLNNLSVLGDERSSKIDSLFKLNNRISVLNSFAPTDGIS